MTVRVYMRHARGARLDGKPVSCAPGIRAWCALHGVDLRKLAREGLPVQQIEAINDAFAQRAAALARAEAAQKSVGIRVVNVIDTIGIFTDMDDGVGERTIINIIRGSGDGQA